MWSFYVHARTYADGHAYVHAYSYGRAHAHGTCTCIWPCNYLWSWVMHMVSEGAAPNLLNNPSLTPDDWTETNTQVHSHAARRACCLCCAVGCAYLGNTLVVHTCHVDAYARAHTRAHAHAHAHAHLHMHTCTCTRTCTCTCTCTLAHAQELVCSFDGASAFRPPSICPRWRTLSSWWHLDQNKFGRMQRDGRAAVQGFVSLTDQSLTTGAFASLPGTHRRFDELCARYAAEMPERVYGGPQFLAVRGAPLTLIN